MHFFGKQRESRTNSHILYLGFVLAMILFMLVVHLGVNAFSMLIGETHSLFASTIQAKVMVGGIWFAVLCGCFFRYLDVRAGGPALARRFKADPADETDRFSNDKALHEVVSEMAIASSCEKPQVFVMRAEHGINAFVVGSINDSKPKALIVTQGALDRLDRDELQAVVGHEFGHIAQGDIPLNMRMLVLLGGLLAIDEIGQILTPKEVFHFGVLVGIPMRILGSVGVFVASLIRSAFSRQREFLADASGVQYSRNPLALASALAKVKDDGDYSTIDSVHAAELAHLCFHAKPKGIIKRIFSSHPPLQKRIDAIDPYFATKKRISERDQSVSDEGDISLQWEQPVTREHFASTSAPLSDRATLLIGDTPSCLAALFALFASDSPIKREEYLEALSFAYSPLFTQQVKHLLDSMPQELEQNKTAILEHVTNHLRDNVQRENRQRLVLNLERLLVVEGEFNLMNYASAQLVRRQLDVEFPLVEQLADQQGQTACQTNVKAFDEMSEEFALLLSLMVEASGANSEKLDEEFSKVLKFYTEQEHPRRVANEPGLHKELERAFQTLYVQPKSVRQAFVQHCVEIMHYDSHVASAEEALIKLFAASLDCDVIAA